MSVGDFDAAPNSFVEVLSIIKQGLAARAKKQADRDANKPSKGRL